MIPVSLLLRLKYFLYAFAALSMVLFQARTALAQEPSTEQSRNQVQASRSSKSQIGIQYEQWFYGPESWGTTEALPLLGKYTTDEATVTKHYSAFQQMGIDWLLIDWSNMLWGKPAWEEHTGESLKLEQRTEVLFQTALHLQQQGKYSPKLVFMIGLQNGPPVPDGVNRLNGIIAWLKKNYLDRPEYRKLWLYEDGKPLLTILYWPPDPCSQLKTDLAQHPLHAEDWTIRWMATQLQDNHAERCGMWSWMDGVIPQVLTMRDGRPEELVVTPASFGLPGKGWTDPSAIAKDHGVPYIESWKEAFRTRPRFIQVHQWNEFTGQANGHGLPADYWGQGRPASPAATKHDVYADEYDPQLSDDIEPTELNACSYRGCGGWGYYYFNLTRAIISLYRGVTPGITVLALSGPSAPVSPGSRSIELHWAFVGKRPLSYSVMLDGKQVTAGITGSSYTLDISRMKAGAHRVQLRALGVQTRFSLDPAKAAEPSAVPLPVISDFTFELASPIDAPGSK